MNRSNSFVSSFKWWPLQGYHMNQTNGNTGDGGGGGGGVQTHHNSITAQHNSHNQQQHHGLRALLPFHRTNTNQTFGSSVAVQKLRESKWFKQDEQRIFCAVVECGFIVEVRSSAAVARNLAQQQHKRRRQRLHSLTNKTQHVNNSGSSNSSSSNDSYEHEDVEEFCKHHQASVQMLLTNGTTDVQQHIEAHNYNAAADNDYDDDDDDDDDDLDLQDENKIPITTWFGVVLCKTGKDNKPKPETIEIYSVKIRENGTFKMIKMSLDDIWKNGWELRINNFADKEKQPHNEKDIRNQDH